MHSKTHAKTICCDTFAMSRQKGTVDKTALIIIYKLREFQKLLL